MKSEVFIILKKLYENVNNGGYKERIKKSTEDELKSSGVSDIEKMQAEVKKRLMEFENLTKELFKKIVAFSQHFKDWQRKEKERCSSCYMTYLFCKSHGKSPKKEEKVEKKEG